MNDRRRRFFCAAAWLPLVTALLHAQVRPLSQATPDDIAAGKRLFSTQCAWCHGTDGVGGSGPSLQRVTLGHAASDTDLISILRNGIAGTEMPGFQWSLTDAMAWKTAAYVRSLGRTTPEPVPGSAERGAAIYDAKGCQACHILGGRGAALGPELTTIGALRGTSYLREAIVKPEAAKPPGFLVVRAAVRAGAGIRGIRVDEDAFWIHIRDAAGQLHVLEKKDLTQIEREPGGTLMPSYAATLTAAELDDLVAYLASRRGAR